MDRIQWCDYGRLTANNQLSQSGVSCGSKQTPIPHRESTSLGHTEMAGRIYLLVRQNSLETPNAVRSVAKQSYNIQATSKSSDQTAHMRRLI